MKSAENWSLPFYDEITTSDYSKDFNPKYLEISFSNVCNFKCSYCMPSVSSQWMEEIEKKGPYPTSMMYNNLEWVKHQQKMPIPLREYNPYIEAFWEWFPEMYKTLHTFRITGGEPLLDKNTFRVLDYIIENPNPSLELSINSNLCIPEQLFDNFLKKIKFIGDQRLVKSVTIYTSGEAYGTHSDYIRFGMNYNQWKQNCYRFIDEVNPSNLRIMSTYNLLSILSFDKFLEDIYNMKLKAFNSNPASGVYIDIPYLNNPQHQIVGLLTSDFIPYIDVQIEYMKKYKNISGVGFEDVEVHKLERIKTMFLNYLENPIPEISRHRKDFSIFVDEHDRRRGTNFLETFPEMKNFYNFCKLQ
jgi:organic radical activating enzyme